MHAPFETSPVGGGETADSWQGTKTRDGTSVMSKKSNVREATMTEISLSPFQRRDNTLAGLVINGRWQDDMRNGFM